MDKIDKTKLKCLIKMILIQKSPNKLSAKQITSIINDYDWGFNISITSKLVSKFIKIELSNSYTFLNNIKSEKNKEGVLVYYYSK